jgi:hypothetical protein
MIGLAGCGQPPAAQVPARDRGLSATTVVPQADPAARWAESYCDAVTQLVQVLATLPTIDPSPARAADTSSDLLTSVVGGLDRAVAGLGAIGAPPMAAADHGRQSVIGLFSEIRQQADQVRQRIDAVRGDPAATKAALDEARRTLDRIAALDLLEGLREVPALEAAGQRAPGCQELAPPRH